MDGSTVLALEKQISCAVFTAASCDGEVLILGHPVLGLVGFEQLDQFLHVDLVEGRHLLSAGLLHLVHRNGGTHCIKDMERKCQS